MPRDEPSAGGTAGSAGTISEGAAGTIADSAAGAIAEGGAGMIGDGGAGQGGMAAPDSGALCFLNASIEWRAFSGDAPGWKSCKNTPDVSPAIAQLAASEGASYLAMLASDSEMLTESAQAGLCSALAPGKTTALELDLTMSAIFGPFGSAVLQIWGAHEECAPEALLWSSPIVAQFDSWQTYCATLSPESDYPYLVLVPTLAEGTNNGNGYLLIDNLRTRDRCPESAP